MYAGDVPSPHLLRRVSPFPQDNLLREGIVREKAVLYNLSPTDSSLRDGGERGSALQVFFMDAEHDKAVCARSTVTHIPLDVVLTLNLSIIYVLDLWM